MENDVLEFHKLKTRIARWADSPVGVQLIEQLTPFAKPEALGREYGIIQECRNLLEKGERFQFKELIDFGPIFAKVRIAGNALTALEILQVLNLALSSQNTRKSLRAMEQECPLLADQASRLPLLQELVQTISGRIDSSGEVVDHASPALRRLRSEAGILRNRLYDSLQRILKRQESAEVMQDDVITIRNDRFVIPVRYEKRREMTGVVHGTSSSGSTLFVEPMETIDLNNQLVRLREQIEAEVLRILGEFTERIREAMGELEAALQGLGQLDSAFARARFAAKFRCVVPGINSGGGLKIEDGRHPLLEEALAARSEKIVPISINLTASRHVLVISGPNTGGKTVALKTIGLLTLMAMSGLPVPAAEARICLFRQVYADIGDRQSISENLSTFSSHLLNIREILERVEPPALVLLDELGTGTDPSEGSALGIAFLERLRNKGVTVVATTHHNGLKMYASRTERVANASVEFDVATLRPTFRLIHGIPGSSSGIEIARRLGLDEELIGLARELVPQEEREVAQFSFLLRQQMEQAGRLKEKLLGERRELERERLELKSRYQKQMEELKRETEKIWQRSRQQFETETQKLLAEIKDKFVAVRARREIEKKGARLREQALAELSQPATRTNPTSLASPSTEVAALSVGSRVRVKRFGQEGTIVASLKEGEWEVAVGNLKLVARSEELESTGRKEDLQEIRPARITVQMSSPELQSNDLNLIGCTAEEAISKTDRFLDQAYLASIPTVRLIHGAGMGILKRALAEWLATQPLVEKFHAASPEQGGNAITVVSLKT